MVVPFLRRGRGVGFNRAPGGKWTPKPPSGDPAPGAGGEGAPKEHLRGRKMSSPIGVVPRETKIRASKKKKKRGTRPLRKGKKVGPRGGHGALLHLPPGRLHGGGIPGPLFRSGGGILPSARGRPWRWGRDD